MRWQTIKKLRFWIVLLVLSIPTRCITFLYPSHKAKLESVFSKWHWKNLAMIDITFLNLFQIFVTFDLFWYSSSVCLEICNATGWYLFKINKTPSTSSSSLSDPSSIKATNSSRKHRWTASQNNLIFSLVIIMFIRF